MPTPRKKGSKKEQPEGQQALFDLGFGADTPEEANPPASVKESPAAYAVSAPADLWSTLDDASAILESAPLADEPPSVVETVVSNADTPPIEEEILSAMQRPPVPAVLENSPGPDQRLAEATLAEMNRNRVAHGDKTLTWADFGLPTPNLPDSDDWLIRAEFLRGNAPVDYLAAALSETCRTQNEESPAGFHISDLVDEVRARGLLLLPPAINHSAVTFSVIGDDAGSEMIMVGLCAIRGLTTVGAETLIAERRRSGIFVNLADFCRRIPFALTGALGVDRDGLLALIWSGALDEIAPTLIKDTPIPPEMARAALVFNYERIWQAGQRQMVQPVYRSDVPVATEGSQQLSLFDSPAQDEAPRRTLPHQPRLDLIVPPAVLTPVTALRRQEAALGFDTASHPLWRWPHVLLDDGGTSGSDWTLLGDIVTQSGSENPKAARLTGMVVGVRHVPATETAPTLIVVGLEDWTGRVDLIVTQDVQVRHGDVLAATGILATLESDKPADRPTLIAFDVHVLADIAEVRTLRDLRDTPPFEVGNDIESVESMTARFEAEVYATRRAASPQADQSAPPQPMFDVPASQPQPAPSTQTATSAPKYAAQRNGGNTERKTNQPAPPATYLYITIPLLDTPEEDDRLMDDIDRALSMAPGNVPVIFVVEDEIGKVRHVNPRRNVAIADSLLDELGRLVGPPNVRPA